MDESDRELLASMRHGNEAGARALWARCSPPMVSYARALLAGRDPGSETDIVQGAFLDALRASARQVNAVREVLPWMLRLTRNAALNHLRGLRRERAKLARMGGETTGSGNAECDSEGLLAHVEALPRALREVIVLRHVAGLTFDQIENATGLNRNTAAARHRAAIERLRTLLIEREEPGSGAGCAREVARARR